MSTYVLIGVSKNKIKIAFLFRKSVGQSVFFLIDRLDNILDNLLDNLLDNRIIKTTHFRYFFVLKV